jgi:predicted DNA-binding protein (MmcQ/YjbR family)
MKTTDADNAVQSYREEVLAFAARYYQTEPEFLWRTAPDYAVLRHSDNKKWYGIIMDVPRKRLGLAGDGTVDILDIKCDPILSGSLRMNEGFLPGYHMNHESWITVLLDGTVEKEQIFSLLEMSFERTASRQKKKEIGRHIKKDWIVPANPKYFDLEKAFSENECILWKQSSHVSVGDMVYFYVAAPVSAICYRCQAVEVDIPYLYDDGKVHMNRAMRVKRLKQYAPTLYTLDRLKEYGILAVRGPRRVPDRLRHEIENS